MTFHDKVVQPMRKGKKLKIPVSYILNTNRLIRSLGAAVQVAVQYASFHSQEKYRITIKHLILKVQTLNLINSFICFFSSHKMSDIPKYINIKKQSILKLLRKILYEVSGVMNISINTAKTSYYKVPCGQIIGWLLVI